ncbi:hypothetical protein [Ensifer adhaerens]|uniref:Uncharacterized protein n=1 Tax=Ensifer adhaerens TaxID=106592 RepID=A0A9Q8YG62_ENSAD|nr:hypothetical protein [Ensifer adhaerens]USJ27606.1 hypothetical protein NE863_34910 [Ensifer adhaerens]
MEPFGARLDQIEMEFAIIALDKGDKRNGQSCKLVHRAAALFRWVAREAAVNYDSQDLAIDLAIDPVTQFHLKPLCGKDVFQPKVKFRIG